MQVVDKRDAATLLPIIQQHTRPGTIIHSDQLAVYRDLAARLPTVACRKTVNHSRHFVDPQTGAHSGADIGRVHRVHVHPPSASLEEGLDSHEVPYPFSCGALT